MSDHPITRNLRLLFPVIVLIGMLVFSLVGSGAALATNSNNSEAIPAQVGGCPGGQITNTNTSATFCDIQSAIDDVGTLNGHTLSLSEGTYSGAGNENINVTKDLTISGNGAGTNPGTDSIVNPNGNVGFNILTNGVTITGLTVENGSDAIRFNLSGATIDNTLLETVWLIDNASHGVNIMNNTNVTNLDIINSTQITGNAVGLGVDSTSQFNGINISGSIFDNVDYGINIVNSGASTTLTNLVVNGLNNFNNHGVAAIHIEELSGSTIENNVFTDNNRGVEIIKNAGTGGISNVIVQNNTFNNSTQSSIFLFVNGIGLNSFSAISNNINQDVGQWQENWGAIEIQLQANQTHGNALIDANTIDFSGTFSGGATAAYGVRVSGGSDDVDITGNTLLGNNIGGSGAGNNPPSAGVLLVTDESTLGPIDSGAEVFITGNNISDFIHGVSVYNRLANTPGGLPGGATVFVSQNNLTGNGPADAGFGVRNGEENDDGIVDASCNWWGDVTGPGPVGPGTGDRVTDNATFQPWLISPAPSGTCSGGETGNLDVIKIVNWGNSQPQEGQVFDICVAGPAPQNPVNVCQDIGFEGGTLSFPNLPAGDYEVYEVDPTAVPEGARWEVTVVIESENGLVTVEPNSTPSATVINSYFPPDSGNLDVTKVVDWNGVTPDEGKTFEICVTGPAPATDQQCQTADFDGEVLNFTDLISGDYTITETDPGSEWSTVITTSPTTVLIGQTVTATVTNTHLRGSAEITKVVDWGESTPNQAQTFEICITGPAPSTDQQCQDVDFDGGVATFPNLIPGDYVVSETDAGSNWTTVISASPITVLASEVPAASTVTNTYIPPVDPGSLVVTKVVDWGESTPNEAQTFEICITGPAPSTAQQCQPVDFDGGDLTFSDLAAGEYTVSETDPGASWTVVIATNPVSVVDGQTATATVTNTYIPPVEPGSLVVTKVVDWGESTPNEGQTFEICITGPAPSTTQQCQPVDFDGGDLTFSDLAAGEYTVSETDPGTSWTVVIATNPVSVVDGQTATATVTNTYIPPVEPGSLVVTKVVDWGEVTPNEAQTFEICITGPAPSTTQQCQTVDFDGGDLVFDNLEPGEYTISETNPGPNWTVVISTDTIIIASNQQASTTVTNTYVPPTGGGTCLIYGVQDEGPLDSQFFTVNLITGEFANLGPLHPGVDIEGIDTHPVTGELYGAGGDTLADGGPIFRIDRDTGEIELLGYTGHGNQVGASFRPTDNSYWVMVSGVGIYVVDLGNPANNTEMVDLSGYNTPGGIAWNADGSLLYVTVDSPGADDLYVYDPSDGSFTALWLNALSIKSEGLEFQPDGTLTVGAHHQTNLAVFNFDILTGTITETNIFPQVPYADVESFTFELFGKNCTDKEDEADVKIVKSGPDTAQLEASVEYVLTVTNDGPDTANGVVVNDVLPAGLVLNEGSLPGYCSYNAGISTITCSIGDLNASASVNIAYVVTATATGSHTNTATVSSDSPEDPNLQNNTDTHTITVTDDPPPTTTVVVEKVWLDAEGQPTDVPADLDGFAIVVSGGGSSMTCTYDAANTLVCDPANLTLPVGGSYNVSEQGTPEGTTATGLGDFVCDNANGCVHTVVNKLPGEEPDLTTVMVDKVWLDADGQPTDVPDNLNGFAIVVTDGNNTMTCSYNDENALVCDPASLSIVLDGSYNVSEVGLPDGVTAVSGTGDFVCDNPDGCLTTVTNQLSDDPIEVPAECEGIQIDNVIYGTEHSDQDEDSIYGTEGNDLIFGLGGHDYIFGLGGDDCIFGGSGDDSIYGGDGNDRIFGQEGQDGVNGGDGEDYIEGNDDSDLLEGGNGNDLIYGNNGNDCIFGGDGNDLIYGGAGSDSPLVGNGGDDIIYGGAGHDQLFGDEYDGRHNGGQTDPPGTPGNDQLFGEGGSDYFDGGPGNDTIEGGDDSDNMFGGEGDDSITGGAGSDAFVGNDGFDTAHDFVLEDWLCESIEVGCDGPPPADSDGDGVPDTEDVCPGFDDNVDTDGDGTPDGCDTTPTGDDDNDGVDNALDICPGFDDNVDTDGDGTPDGCDTTPTGDDDNDGVDNALDICPGFDDNMDADGDGTPDDCDTTPTGDDDNDGVDNAVDVCPGFDDNVDTDGDGTPDGCDTTPTGDDDNDGVDNALDICPGFDDNVDTDGDGTPDDCDTTPTGDDDNDGVDNVLDICPGFDDNVDTDGDGTPDGCDSTPNGEGDTTWLPMPSDLTLHL